MLIENQIKHIEKKAVLCLLSFLPCVTAFSITPKTVISNQAGLDIAIQNINAGKSANIELSPGEYILSRRLSARSPLCISGKNAIIKWANENYSTKDAIKTTQTHYICRLRKSITPFSLFIDKANNIISVSESVNKETFVNETTDSIIGSYQKKVGIDIKIPISDNLKSLKNKTYKCTFGYFDCGWARINFRIKKSDSKHLYCTTLDCSNVENFNYDITRYKKSIRYVIYNAELQPDKIYYDDKYIYIPQNIDKVEVLDQNTLEEENPSIVSKSDLILSGVTFKNFNGITIISGEKNTCNIENCKFENTLGNTLKIVKANGNTASTVMVSNCTFEHCALLSGIIINLASETINRNCITISNCTISRYTQNWCYYKNWVCALNVNADATLIGNTIYNSCRNHIEIHHGQISLKDNILFNTPEFNSRNERNLSSDWGLIYCGNVWRDTKKALSNTRDKVIIEGNLLHGAYAFGNNARGIFIDDGRGDITCRYNTILNTQMFSLDSREVPNYTETSSIRNIFSGNIVDNRYRLQCGIKIPQKWIPTSSKNICLGHQANITTGIREDAKDIVIEDNGKITIQKECISFSSSTLKKIKKQSVYKFIKKHIL